MAKKKVKTQIKLQIPAGSANPAPPVGPALGQHGVNIMDFCNQFNAKTKTTEAGMIIPAVITIYADRSFSFILKMPPVSALLKKAVGLAKASGEPNKTKVGKITKKQAEEIAKQKLPDLNTDDITSAVRIVEGTARSMGIEIGEQASSIRSAEANETTSDLAGQAKTGEASSEVQGGGGKLEQKNG